MAKPQRARSLFSSTALSPEGENTLHAPKSSLNIVAAAGVSEPLALPDVKAATLLKSWFLGAHLLLPPGSKVADMGCEEGEMAYSLAKLHPEWDVVGVDASEAMFQEARQTYQADNLSFTRQNAWALQMEDESLDAVITSFLLHDIYSNTNLNDRLVSRTLSEHYRVLKNEGLLLVRDYALPSAAAYVLMEFPANSGGQSVADMSEPDLLVHYSEVARSGQQGALTGFFLEELPPRFPHTRLFRLPYKWAYEFILRKDDREGFEGNLAREYTFYTEWDYRRELRALGARILYSSPHYDDSFIATRCEGRFRLYREDGSPLPFPPTSHIIVAQKIDRPRSMALAEQRSTGTRPASITIQSMRDEVTGRVVEIASRKQEIAEMLPFRLTDDGKLKIYLLDGLPRGLVNAVPRLGRNLDGRIWSGHMVEPLSLLSADLLDLAQSDQRHLRSFVKDHYGLRPSDYDTWLEAPPLFPDPASLDERVITQFLRITDVLEDNKLVFDRTPDSEGFANPCRLKEYDAQAILDAISVGLIPSARLELQIQWLCSQLDVSVNTWAESPLLLEESDKPETLPPGKIISHMAQKDRRFKGIKGTANQLRPVQSIFVEEGQDDNGGINGLAARPLDFVVPEENTINTAVILPLTKNINGEVMAEVIVEHLPVPQRYKGNGTTIRAPSITLPKDIQSIEDARKYIAEKFEVDVKHVTRMGESYYTHVGMTPHRIYPFAVTDKRGISKRPLNGVTDLSRMKWSTFWKLNWFDCDTSFLHIMGRAYKKLSESSHQLQFQFAKQFTHEHESSISLTGEYVSPGSDGSSSSGSSSSSSGSGSASGGGSNGGGSGAISPNAEAANEQAKTGAALAFERRPRIS
jgi:hypothetical protein